MISDLATVTFILILAAIAVFIVWNFRNSRHHELLPRLYLALVLIYVVLAISMIGMRFTGPDQVNRLFVLDCMSSVGYGIPAIYLLISVVFVKGYDRMPKWGYALLVVPVLSVLIIATNPLHHLQYIHFAVIRSEIVFGPYVMVTGAYSYLCFIASIVLLVRFAVRNHTRLYIKQCMLLSFGGLCALVVSVLSTLAMVDLSITATPLSFLPIVVCNGIAIYQLNLLDIKPIARRQLLDWTSDCYLILSDKGLVVSFNKPFAEIFASRYGITENRYLRECVGEEDVSKKTAIYNLITAVDSCRDAMSTISYEQAMTLQRDGGVQKNYYVTDVSPLILNQRHVGYIAVFKDITQLKHSMQQLQESQNRMMEQERFAFLGQMVGGLAHNLKTPIMSISGCVSAAEALIDECESSLADSRVTDDDFREIYGEMRDWLGKVRESSAYMSDIITAIKGQVSNVGMFGDQTFTVDELLKRTTLLMRHELMSSGCSLEPELDGTENASIRGDINNLVQVLGNLVSNAVYAQRQTGGGPITVGMERQGENLRIYVKDTGPGVSDAVKRRLFREMVTSKGAAGSGLGLYISNAVVRAKFGGEMWVEDNPGGGAIFGFTIPLDVHGHTGEGI
jgi:two-component system sensor histidine kinase HupT/HoxJ